MLRRHYSLFIFLLSVLSCLPEMEGLRSNSLKISQQASEIETNSIDTPIEMREPEVILRHIIDPYDGNYKTKITIPKNFSGVMLIAGLNLSKLKYGEDVFVRFRFGRNLTTFVQRAWIGPVPIPGLTSSTTIDVLHVDLSKSPFKSQRLIQYHLYDYNRYEDHKKPVIDPFDDQLYCRALFNKHDPTFQQSSESSECRTQGKRCLYSYAQVLDQGPYLKERPLVPLELQFALNKTGLYGNETHSDISKKCLADNANDLFTLGSHFTIPKVSSPGPIIFTIGNDPYQYRGPYQSRNVSSWQIKGNAISGSDNEGNFWGLFKKLAHSGEPETGFYSLRFPLAGRLPIRKGVQYIGEEILPTDTRPRGFDLTTQDLEESLLMDGCNLRVAHFDPISQEGLGSCDVTALIELVKKDPETGQFLVLHGINETRLKVQLVRKTTKISLESKELLSSNFRGCHSNNSCGGNECCYSNRCWSRDIVTQCLDDSQPAQRSNGEACSSDLECQGLCCSPTTGTCRAHDGKQNLCSKPLGNTCIADEFCGKVNQTQYRIIKTGINPVTGEMTCERRPFNVQVFANCVRSGNRGICQTPPVPEVPPFNPSNPDCSNAEPPPTD